MAVVATATIKIGTRGSPLALAQAYMTRDLLKVPLGLRPLAHALRAPQPAATPVSTSC